MASTSKVEERPRGNRKGSSASVTRTGKAEDLLHETTLACDHLWNSSNTLLSAAPTIATHLGKRLMTQVLSEDMNDRARAELHTLVCTRCGRLGWTAWTRIRKRPRVYKGARNRVLTRCVSCHAVLARPASRARCPERSDNRKIRNNPRLSDPIPSSAPASVSSLTPSTSRITPRAVHLPKQAVASGTSANTNFSTDKLRILSTSRARKKTNKSRSRRDSLDSISTGPSFQRPGGLAASFLFEDIEE